MSDERWMLYPVRSEQIRAAASDDHDHAEWVIRADGPVPQYGPVEVVPRSEAEALAEALEAVNLVNPPAALAEYRAAYPREETP